MRSAAAFAASWGRVRGDFLFELALGMAAVFEQIQCFFLCAAAVARVDEVGKFLFGDFPAGFPARKQERFGIDADAGGIVEGKCR